MRLYRRYLFMVLAIYVFLLLFIYRSVQNSKDASSPGEHYKWRKNVENFQTKRDHPMKGIAPVSPTTPRAEKMERPANSACPKLPRPPHAGETHRFQQVDGKNDTFVFSAFVDERDKVVRVISVRLHRAQARYTCHLWYHVTEGGVTSDLSVTSAATENLPESQGKKYTAAYIHCPLPQTRGGTPPYAVSVTSQPCDVTAPTNVIPVMAWTKGKIHNFTICMKPVNMKYSRTYEAIEFIEISRILGATKIQVYVTSIGPNVLELLKWYQTQGVVELIDWPIDKHMRLRQWPPSSKNPPDIHAFGQIGASNDCLNRNRRSSRYLVLIDWDEVLAPRKQNTWMELITALNQKHHKPAGEYRFACLFFRKDFPHRHEDFPGRDIAEKYQSMVVMVNQREKQPLPFSTRTKYIVDPERVHVTGIHTVHKHRPNEPAFFTTITVSHDMGLNYHYRNWEKPSEFSSKGVQDDELLRFRDALLGRIQHIWSFHPNLTMDIPLSAYGPVV